MDTQRSEYLLRLLSKAASLCESDRGAALLLLREAQAHLWRLSPTEPLSSALQLERQLSLPLESWLPESVRFDYTGPLLSSGISTQTCNEMLLELDVHQLWEEIQSIVREVRDLCQVISKGDELYRRFRRFLIENAVIDPVWAASVFIPLGRDLGDFYEPIPEHLAHNGKLYQCPECRWPMNPQRREVQCDSAWCREKTACTDGCKDGWSMLSPTKCWKAKLRASATCSKAHSGSTHCCPGCSSFNWPRNSQSMDSMSPCGQT